MNTWMNEWKNLLLNFLTLGPSVFKLYGMEVIMERDKYF